MVCWSNCVPLSWVNVWTVNWLYGLKGPRDKMWSVSEPVWPLRKLIDYHLRKSFSKNIFSTDDALPFYKFFLHVTFCLPFLGDWRVRCKGMSYHVMKARTLWRVLVWPQMRVCEIRGCLFYLYHAFIILHPTTDLCHGNVVSMLHCWLQSGPEGLVSRQHEWGHPSVAPHIQTLLQYTGETHTCSLTQGMHWHILNCFSHEHWDTHEPQSGSCQAWI